MAKDPEPAARPPLLLRRAAARFFDAGVLLLGAFVLPLVLRARGFGEQEAAALGALLAAVAWWLYETALVAWWGATVGKRLMDIRVVDEAGRRPSLSRAAVRAVPVLLLLNALLGLVAVIAWASAAVLPGGRGLHDRVAGTTVVRAPWRPDAARG